MTNHVCTYFMDEDKCLVCKKPKPTPPDVFIVCHHCKAEWMVWLPRDTNHTYYMLKEKGVTLCPACIREHLK